MTAIGRKAFGKRPSAGRPAAGQKASRAAFDSGLPTAFLLRSSLPANGSPAEGLPFTHHRSSRMFNFDANRAGATLLRISLGLMFIAHSVVLKYFMFTLAGTAQFFASIGLPAPLAYVVFAAEAIGGVLLVLGLQTRWVALSLIPVLIGATWTHIGNGWVFSNANGGWEYPFYLIVISMVVALQAETAKQTRAPGIPASLPRAA
jgi:putative oxidoreductase